MENTLTTLVRKLIPDGGFAMVWSIIGILLAVYLLLCFLAWLSDKQRDIIAKYYRPKKVLDATEEKFFKLLRAAVPADCYVFPHVSMRALIATNHWDFWAPFNLKRVDFVICNAALNIVCVVELEGENQQKRHLRREKMLQKAGVNILRYRVQNNPSVEEMQKDIALLVRETKN